MRCGQWIWLAGCAPTWHCSPRAAVAGSERCNLLLGPPHPPTLQAYLKQAIEEAGFGCSPLGSGAAATLQLAVGGMVCSSCSAAVEAALRGADGVLEASASLLTNKAEVGGVARDWQGAEGVRVGRTAAGTHAACSSAASATVRPRAAASPHAPPATCTRCLRRCGTIRIGWAPASSSLSYQRLASKRSPPLTSTWTAPRCARGRRGCVQQRWLPNRRGGTEAVGCPAHCLSAPSMAGHWRGVSVAAR
jgi:copper chaperone CopZ